VAAEEGAGGGARLAVDGGVTASGAARGGVEGFERSRDARMLCYVMLCFEPAHEALGVLGPGKEVAIRTPSAPRSASNSTMSNHFRTVTPAPEKGHPCKNTPVPSHLVLSLLWGGLGVACWAHARGNPHQPNCLRSGAGHIQPVCDTDAGDTLQLAVLMHTLPVLRAAHAAHAHRHRRASACPSSWTRTRRQRR
jgi:hypothetical protein